MLWKLVDIAAILGAIGLLLLLGPDVIGLKKWKQRFAGRTAERLADQSAAGPSPEEPRAQ